jgi:hypothetical protein
MCTRTSAILAYRLERFSITDRDTDLRKQFVLLSGGLDSSRSATVTRSPIYAELPGQECNPDYPLRRVPKIAKVASKFEIYR